MSSLQPPQPPTGTPPTTHQQTAGSESVAPKKVKQTNKVDLNNLPDLLTIREVSELLRVSPLTLKRWGKRGKLSAIRINSRGDRRYKKTAVLWLLGMTDTSVEG